MDRCERYFRTISAGRARARERARTTPQGRRTASPTRSVVIGKNVRAGKPIGVIGRSSCPRGRRKTRYLSRYFGTTRIDRSYPASSPRLATLLAVSSSTRARARASLELGQLIFQPSPAITGTRAVARDDARPPKLARRLSPFTRGKDCHGRISVVLLRLTIYTHTPRRVQYRSNRE